jgi:hypothetical protein
LKFILTVLTLSIINFALGQKSTIERVWIGDSLEYMQFDGVHATFQFSEKYGYHNKKGYHLLRDTLRLQDWFYSSADNSKTLRHKDYDFMVRVRRNTLELQPINQDAFWLAGNRSRILFKPIDNFYKKSFDFDSLKFTSTTCYGTCPEMTIVIKGNKVFFTGGRHAVKQGSYEAFLSDALHYQLTEHLRKSAIDKIINWNQDVDDAPYYTLTIFYRRKTKHIEGFDLPLITKDLLKFLLHLPKQIEKDLQ